MPAVFTFQLLCLDSFAISNYIDTKVLILLDSVQFSVYALQLSSTLTSKQQHYFGDVERLVQQQVCSYC